MQYKNMSLIIKKNTTFKIPRTPFLPSSLAGLALWLKADTGVSNFSYNYVSQIIISGTSNPSFAGTYTANGVPTYNSEQGYVNSYYFTGPAGKTMSWSADDGVFILNSSGETSDSFTSANGVNWTAVNGYISQIVITGFTGTYAGANGTYSGSDGYFERVGGGFFISEQGLIYTGGEENILIATAPANYSGSWTPTNYVSSVTLTGAGTTSVNGTYTRPDTLGDTNNFALGSTLIKWEGALWFLESLTSPFYPYVINSFELAGQWVLATQGGSPGASPAPSGSTATSARSVGSPTSATSTTPSGSISGTVTNATENTSIVTAWADQSENENNTTARTGNVTLVSSVINGKPVLRFDGTANLITNNFFSHNYDTPITIIAVSKASASTVRGEQLTARYIAGVTNSGGYEFGLSYGAYDTEFPNFSNSYGISYVGGQDIESSPMGENEKRIASTINNGSEISFFLDGNLIGTADPISQNSGNNSTGEFSIGSDVVLNEIDNFFCVCDIAEIIIYNRALTISERQQVEAYLNQKYAIY
jgi:hypothetical protein